MNIRKIKDAKDISTNELIYFKGHAKATYMSNGATVEDAINNIKVGTGADLSDYATKEELSSKQDTITDLETIRRGAAKGATSVQQGTLSTVATSGSYNDLTNKPTIPNAVSESTVSGWGFTKNTGTVTGVKINGSTKNPSNGVVDLGTVITSHQDITGKQDKLVSGTNIKTINGNSLLGSGDITISGSGNQLQSDWNETDTTSPAYIANKPNINVLSDSGIDLSGSINMYTSNAAGMINLIITNGQISLYYPYRLDYRVLTIDGTGNGTKFLSDDGTYKEITTSSSSSGGAYGLVEHGTSDTSFTLTSNTFHVWDEVGALTLTLGEETAGVANEYFFQFISGTEPTVLTLPDSIKWANDEIPIIESGYIYQVSILKGFATLMKFVLNTKVSFPVIEVSHNADYRDLY